MPEIDDDIMGLDIIWTPEDEDFEFPGWGD